MSGSDAGVCFRSHQHLVDRCEVSVSTVRRALQELAARKRLSVVRRFNKNGSCTCKGYRLAIADHPVRTTPSNCRGGCSRMNRGALFTRDPTPIHR
jgi:DNA-binding transcriptional MocR family regulator